MRQNEFALWIIATAVAALGAWIMFDGAPGLGWSIWVTVAAAALLIFVRHDVKLIVSTGAIAAIIAWGATVTADPIMYGLIFLFVVLFLALSMLLSSDPVLERITPAFTVAAPVVAFASAILEAVGRATNALHLVRSQRARSVVRGIAITAPVILIFALLLAGADPIFANIRDNIGRILESWHFLPRTIFFFALLVCTLGTYGFAANVSSKVHAPAIEVSPRRWLGATERIILIGSVTALLWIFLAVQLSYLFGNVPTTAGSDLTFAEYAQRGFAELTIVASASVFLILFGERFGEIDNRKNLIRILTLALIIAVLLVLGSAFRRVLLYEGAYGFTTSRLYAQTYMVVVAVTLVWLAVELRSELNPARLFRVAGFAATIAFMVLLYWNHEAWIADRNIDRVASTGKLDVSYLTRDLSPNAVPLLIARLSQVPEPFRTETTNQLHHRYSQFTRLNERHWYEYNVRRRAAREALLKLGVNLASIPSSRR